MRTCTPQRSTSGECYINPNDPNGEVDVYHLTHEFEQGRVVRVKWVKNAISPDECEEWCKDEGHYVAFGYNIASLVEEVRDERYNPV